MRYVNAGYAVILTLLFLYSVQLVWRRRRLQRSVARTLQAGGMQAGGMPAGGMPAGGPGTTLSGSGNGA